MTRLIVGVSLVTLLFTFGATGVNAQNVAQVDGTGGVGCPVHGVVGDFERHLDRVPDGPDGGGRLVAFLGGTIGNFPPGSRRRMLRDIARMLGPGDHVLLGTDLVKDPEVIACCDAHDVAMLFTGFRHFRH